MSGALSAQWELGKMWLSFAWTEERTPTHPMPMNGKGYWGYDASAKRYVGVWVDGSGAIMNGTSPGWVDEKLVWTWEGAMMGRPAQVRGTWARAGGKIAGGVWHLNLGEGWIQLMDMTFT